MLTSVHLQPNNVLYFKEIYPSKSGQKDSRHISTDMSDFYHSNSSEDLGSALDIDFEFQQPLNNSNLPRRGYGLLPRPCMFTSRAKDTIYQSGGALDKTDCTTIFLTGTLPASTPAAYETLASYSAYILNRLKTKINQISKKRDAEYYYLSVWEFQQRGALHLHICISSPQKDFLQELLLLWKIYWVKLLKKVEDLSSIPLLSAPDGYKFSFSQIQAPAQLSTSGVASYLAKYLSKDSSKVIKDSVNLSRSRRANFFSPGRWFSKSSNVKALISRHSVCVTEDSPIYAGSVFNHLIEENIPFEFKEIRRPYTDKLSYRLIIPSESFDSVKLFMLSLSCSLPTIRISPSLFSPRFLEGARLLKHNFLDFLESIRHMGLPLSRVYDYSSFLRNTTFSEKQGFYLYQLWRSGFIHTSYEQVQSLLRENKLTDLLNFSYS